MSKLGCHGRAGLKSEQVPLSCLCRQWGGAEYHSQPFAGLKTWLTPDEFPSGGAALPFGGYKVRLEGLVWARC